MLLKKICIILISLSLLFITGCHSFKSDVEKADDLTEKGKFTEAHQIYKNVLDYCEDDKIRTDARHGIDKICNKYYTQAKTYFDRGQFEKAKKNYQFIVDNAVYMSTAAKAQEKLDTFDSEVAELTERKRITEYYRKKSIERGFKMPPFETVDATIGKIMTIVAILLDDQSRDNIIHTAFCFKNQSGNSNVFVYFVKDSHYSLQWKDKLTHKVKAAYVHVNGRSILYLFNPDGTEETIDI